MAPLAAVRRRLETCIALQEVENVCSPVITRPVPTVDEAPEADDQDGGAHNGPAASQGADVKGDTKGSQQTKSGSKEMEVD